MSTYNFQVREHVVPCCHVRDFPRAVQNEDDDVLHLHVKSYVPLSNSRAEPFDMTFVAAHANGVPKEMYEPLWDELLAHSRKSRKFRIRSIWIADAAHQGQSSVLNEGKLGNDPSWQDHPRDLFLMINYFRKAMPQPIIGIGHSFGGNNILQLSLMHPRLFSSIIMLDPVAQKLPTTMGNFNPAYASSFRRDLWPSREVARAAFLKSSFYKSWDSRVFELWMKYGLRDLPTELYPDDARALEQSNQAGRMNSIAAAELSSDSLPAVDVPTSTTSAKPVTLTTTKHQEVFTFVRSKHPAAGEPLSAFIPTRRSHPDMRSDVQADRPFYGSASTAVFEQLPHVRPSCLYILGENSSLVPRDVLDERLAITGAGDGGSGGVAEDVVREVLVKNGGHFFPFEKPHETAFEIGQWLDHQMPIYRRETSYDRAQWARLKPIEKNTLGADQLWWTKQDMFAIRERAKTQTEAEKEAENSAAGSRSRRSKI